MSKRILTLAAALSLLAGGTALTHAQDVTVDAETGVDAEVSVDAGDDSVGAGAGADVSAEADTLSSAKMALEAGNTTDLSTVTDQTEIEIVEVSMLEADADVDMNAMIEAMGTSDGAMAEFQASAEANQAIKARLEEEGYEVSDVVAISTTATGGIVVFVNDADM